MVVPQDSKTQRLVICSIADSSLTKLQERLSVFGYSFTEIISANDVTKLNTKDIPRMALIELDPEKESKEVDNIIKNIRKISNVMKIIGVFKGHLSYNPETMIKKGFDYVYQLPFEEEVLINCVFEYAPVDLSNENLTLDSLSRVNILELEWAEGLPFDIFVCLPTNKKIIHYRQKGKSLDEKTVEKFKIHKEFSIYIKKSDLSKYYNYSAQILSRLQKDDRLSKIEKEKKIAGEIKKMIGGLFSQAASTEKEGQEMFENVRKVLGQLEDSSGSKKQFAKTVIELAAQNMTNYSHCRNVATYCTLFGLALGFTEPETLQMGGFLHDIGMADLPTDLLQKNFDQMSEAEKAQYRLHPGNASYTVKFKKMKLPENVLKMILQHHERPDGSGFPYGLKSESIDPLAKICAFADEFDELTSMRFGHATLTPVEAMKKIAGLDGNTPSAVYEDSFFKPLVKAFLEDFGESLPDESPTVNATDVFAPTDGAETVPTQNIHPVNEPLLAPVEQTMQAPANVVPTPERMVPVIGGTSPGVVKVVTESEKSVSDATAGQTPLVPPPVFAVDAKPLFDAVINADVDAVQKLLKSGADINVKDDKGQTPIMYALKSGKRDFVKAMLRAKADINIPDPNGNTPLMQTIENHNFEMFNLLLVHSFESSFVPQADAGKTGKVWVSNVLDINLQNHAGENALMLAARVGADSALEALLDAGADIYAKGKDGATVMDVAKKFERTDMIETLNKFEEYLKRNSGILDEAAPEGENKKPKDASIDVKSRDKTGQTPLLQFAAIGNEDMVKKLLALNSDVEAKDFSGHTALMLAARKGNSNIVRQLIEKNANVQAKDSQGRNSLIHAIEGGGAGVIKLLVEKGLKIDGRYLGCTPLMVAAYTGNAEVVKALLAGGANPADKDSKGKTAYDFAQSKNFTEIMSLLEAPVKKKVA